LWTSYYNRYGDLNQAGNLDRCLAGLMRSKHIRTLIPDFARIKRDLETAPVSYGRLFALVHEHHAEKIGKTRWGDQTEFIERYADHIFSAYPDAKFIHMLRDPRDRYEAMQHKSHRRSGLGVATARWHASAMLAQRNQSKYSGHYKVIRYEAMVTNPETILYETCEFLGEEFFSNMIQIQGETRFAVRNQSDKDESRGPLTTKYIGGYRNGLSIREVAYTQKQLERLMSTFGYSLDPIRFSWNESLRSHLLDETVNSFYKLGWQIKDITKNIKLWNTDRSS
jgi:hypothetical protein